MRLSASAYLHKNVQVLLQIRSAFMSSLLQTFQNRKCIENYHMSYYIRITLLSVNHYDKIPYYVNLHFLTARQRYRIMHLSIPINFPSKIYISNDLLSLSFYEYTSNMLLRSINIKPSPRLFASIAPNTQPVAANTSNQSSTSTSTKKGSRLRKPALSLDQVHIAPVMRLRE
jgi:hypothetical protein